MASHDLGTSLTGKRERPSLQRIHTCERVFIILEGTLQYSAHTIIHIGKSLKTFRRLMMVSGYSFEFPSVGVFVWACRAFTLSDS